MTRDDYIKKREVLDESLKELNRAYSLETPAIYSKGMGATYIVDNKHKFNGTIEAATNDFTDDGYRIYVFLSWDFGGTRWHDNLESVAENKLTRNTAYDDPYILNETDLK